VSGMDAEHLYKLMFDDLSICGCGQPDAAYALVRDLLALTPFHEDDNWKRAEELIGTPGAVHLVLCTLDEARLIEHGGVVTGAWITGKGAAALAAMCELPWDAVHDAGYPHNGADCTDACWPVDSAGIPRDGSWRISKPDTPG
jgi:hypothetical protein